MGVGHFGRRAKKHAWESAARSQMGHPSGCSLRSDRVLIKFDASIGERNIYFRSTRRKCMFDGNISVIVNFHFGSKISFLLYNIKYYIVR